MEQFKFQFHYGSVKRIHGYQNHKTLIYFNSTMVRLKGVLLLSSKQQQLHFNSTMVRLKGCGNCQAKLPFRQFQFHYGSVKSRLESFLCARAISFQFHYGSVKSKKLTTITNSFIIISIPLWFG